MTRHADREVAPQDVDPGTALQRVSAGPERDGLLAMFADYTAHGLADLTADRR